jgi:nitrile hydratase
MSARFRRGQRVRIADRDPTRHNRTPRYLRGQLGVVERVCPAFGQPELLAYGGDGKPDLTLYRVRLKQRDLWPDYAGPAQDHLEAEIFEHWLEPV